MRSARVVSFPKEYERSEDDYRSYCHASESLRSEPQHQRDNHAERNGPEHERCCDGHTHETHHKKANGYK